MNVRSAGFLAKGKIFIDVAKRMRAGGHNAPSVLCRMTTPVNSKTFFVRRCARSETAKLLLKKANNNWPGESGQDSRDTQKKSGFQQATLCFGRALRSDINFFLSCHHGCYQQTDCDCPDNPWYRFAPDR